MPIHDRLTRQLRHGRVSRRTVRMRLTLLYGALFLLSGTGLLAITYLLVQHSTAGIILKDQGSTLVVGNDGTIRVLSPGRTPPSPGTTPRGAAPGTTPPGIQTTPNASPNTSPSLPPDQAQALHTRLTAQAARQRAALSREFITQSAITLSLMSVASIGLGWIMAGRVLRPLRTITTATRKISATNLHQRLALHGPHDELKELGETIDDLLARLEASFQSQHRFVANVSHELRTPLAVQRTAVQVALSDPHPSVESLQASHKRVLNATYHQERLIDALLTLARGEQGLDRRKALDLAEVAHEVLLARDGETTRRGIHLSPTLHRAPTFGDPQLVERLVTNLVDNALKYNKVSGRLEISTASTANGATLSVANTGPVVPVHQMDRLFQPFQRLAADRTHQDGGLGLGLSIVQAIATAHGATIHASPRPTGGMEIIVTFPSAETSVQANPRPALANSS